jgi:hypothetical protein
MTRVQFPVGELYFSIRVSFQYITADVVQYYLIIVILPLLCVRTSGLVVKFLVAIEEPRVRFPAGAITPHDSPFPSFRQMVGANV